MSRLSTLPVLFISLLMASLFYASPALATPFNDNFNTIFGNIIESFQTFPGLLAAFAYLGATFFGVRSVMLTREHVENPGNVTLSRPLANFAGAGALFALPFMYEIITNSFLGTGAGDNINDVLDDFSTGLFSEGLILGAGGVAGWASLFGVLPGINDVVLNIFSSINQYPTLVSAFAYLTGLGVGIAGIIKIKAHVENPQQVPLREGLSRLGLSGLLLSLPFVLTVAVNTISDSLPSALTAILSGVFGIPLDPLIGGGATDPATINEIVDNLISSSFLIPVLVMVSCYFFGISLVVWGLFNRRAYADSPQNGPLSSAMSRMAIGGALMVLPFMIGVAVNTVQGGIGGLITTAGVDATAVEDLDAATAGAGVNTVSDNIIASASNIPSLITFVAYIAGILLCAKALLQTMTFVNTGGGGAVSSMRYPIIKLLTGGALIALPYIYEVLTTSFSGNNTVALGPLNVYSDGGGGIMFMLGGQALGFTSPTDACTAATGITTLFCNVWSSTSSLPGVFAAFCYVAGLVFGYLGLMRLKDSVEEPQQVPVTEGISKFVICAMLLLLPYVMNTAYISLVGTGGTADGFQTTLMDPAAGTPPATPPPRTLDVITSDFVFSIYRAMGFIFTAFGYMAGIVLIIIGIFRMMNTMRDGPRGPGGVGTIMTFVAGAALLALSPMMGAISTTIFGDGNAENVVTIALGTPSAELAVYQARIENFMTAVIAYMMIAGWVSFIRGLFILRAVAEGDQQASMMSAVTHIFAGALLANMGPFLTAVQATLGIGAIAGLTFG